MTETDAREVCRWYAMCGNPAVGTADHPMGPVPICTRCADKHEVTPVPFPSGSSS